MAADRTEGIQHFTAQEQAGMAPALERAGMHLAQIDAAAGHLGLGVAFVAGPRQRVAGEGVDQPAALRAGQPGQRLGARNARLGEQRLGQAIGKLLAHRAENAAGAGAQERVPGVAVESRPLHQQAARRARAGGSAPRCARDRARRGRCIRGG